MSAEEPEPPGVEGPPRGRRSRRRDGCIAILVKRFPRLSETFVLNEFLELRRVGVPVRLIALEDPQERHVQADAEALLDEVVYLRDRGFVLVDMLRWGLRRPSGMARAVGYALRRRSRAAWRHLGDALSLGGHLRTINARHVHAHFAHSPAETAYLAHLISGVSFSFTAHAKDLYTTTPSRIATAGRAAAFLTTCTGANGAYLGRIVGCEVLVYPHGVDLARFGAIVRRSAPGRILSIGRLVPKKGFEVLLAALATLTERGVSFECRIVGGGSNRDDLSALSRRLGLDGRVTFAGARPQDDLLEEYASAEIFVLAPVVTSNGDRDGLPNVLLEAMAAGIPVVSSSISGIPELITDDVSGVLVPPGDSVALADALERLLTDEVERKRLAAGGLEAVTRRGLDTCVRPLAERLLARLAPSPVRDAFGSQGFAAISEDESR